MSIFNAGEMVGKGAVNIFRKVLEFMDETDHFWTTRLCGLRALLRSQEAIANLSKTSFQVEAKRCNRVNKSAQLKWSATKRV